jgi:stage V sporulation protein D (sporulation-specific penicillin-binding protein)
VAVWSERVRSDRPWAAPRRRTQQARARSQPSRLRVLWLLGVVVILAGAIWGRLAYWQVAEHERLARLAASYHLVQIPLPATRGMIYDREGRPLAVNTTVYDVSLAANQVEPVQREQVADALSGILGVSRAKVMEVLRSRTKFWYVAHRVPKDQADRLRRLMLPGVYLTPRQQRTYMPGGAGGTSLASQLLGFVDDQGQGQRGVEQRYDGVLGGRPGSVVAYRDMWGDEIALSDRQRREPVDGQSLQLTIDSDVQVAAERAIAEGVRANHAQSGSVIVMDSRTGGIVAWASAPAYDANHFATSDPSRFADPVVSSLYEPGSVMKVVTLAGALDQGKITPDTTVSDPGYVNVGGVTLHDWDDRAKGEVTMTRVLDDSLNVGAVEAEQMEGSAAFFHYLQAFGFGRPSGVDVADESWMSLGDTSQWRTAQVATASYGQGIAVNMVQMVAALNVIANGGRYVQPHVVEKVGGRSLRPPAERQVVTPRTAATMTAMMEDVVQHGSGWMARIPGFQDDEAGKTGTSNIPVGGHYTSQVWASYAGFLPAHDPRFTMLVVVRAPNNGSSDHDEGYYVAAPIWKRIAQDIILQWRITPEGANPSN